MAVYVSCSNYICLTVVKPALVYGAEILAVKRAQENKRGRTNANAMTDVQRYKARQDKKLKNQSYNKSGGNHESTRLPGI